MCFSLAAATTPTFEADVQPIFATKCVMCHGAAPQGKLDLRTQQSVLNGGASGPVVLAGDSAKSLLLNKVVTRQMPPGNVKLTDTEIDRIRIWIDKGLTPEVPVAVSEHEVRAIFQVRCVLCHGSGDRKGGLDMRTLASRLKGGKSGPGLVPGKPEESLIYQRIVKGQMPPDKLAKDLAVELPTASETEKIRAWIAAGAPGPVAINLPPDATVKEAQRQFWSFQPPKRPVRADGQEPTAGAQPDRCLSARETGSQGTPLLARGRPSGAHAARLPGRYRRPTVARRRSTPTYAKTNRRTPTKSWWTACSLRRVMASVGGSTGSTSRATPIPKASARTMACAPPHGAIATT